MTEKLTDYTQRLEFNTLHAGDQLVITTGQGVSAWRYDFTVEAANHWPLGILTGTNPAGGETPPEEFALHGCGSWTTRSQNPVQSHERGFTPYYDGLIVGKLLWAKHASCNERLIFGRPENESYFAKHPGDEISVIARTPYRQNAVLNALRENGRLSVAAVVEALSDSPIELTSKDIRSTLMDMVKNGHVSLLRKNVILFELPTQQ